ncbi:girdin [Brachionichthys hirsutus]|uniref:girdin n=1 Tax=Brachionichthys hirsutus TaxID=412623 RepID=UPI0036044841
MEGGAFLPALDQFMLSPLVTWVRTFVPHERGMHLDFPDLIDGVILNDIMTQINPTATPQGANKASRDANQRTQNLKFLVQQIKTYYLDNLRQLILIPLPNVLLLGRTPYCEQSLEEIKKILLLLLGCAVQCEKKDGYIQRIQTLNFETKAAIAAHIQQLTHSQESMLDLQWLESSEVSPDELGVVARSMATHLRHLLDQRDACHQTLAELMQEKEGVASLVSSPSGLHAAGYSPSMQQQQAGAQQHLAVELADSKAKIRRLRQELEEKSEQMLDCRHELENMEAELKRIQQENAQLLGDARAARTYRDELDALRERAVKADKLEIEVGRYRDQLHKMEFYKIKVEELKEDNRVLQETKEVLEDQLAGWRARLDNIHHLEKHNLQLAAQVHGMEQERESDGRRIEELQNDNLVLCLAQRRSMEESQLLGWELEQLANTAEDSQGQQTLSEEVSERTLSRMLKLEMENQRLLRSLEELRAAATNSSTKPDRVIAAFQHSCSDVERHSNAPLEHGDGEHRFKGPVSELEDSESNHAELRRFVESHDRPPVGSTSSSPCRDGILTTRSSSYASKHRQRLEDKCRALDTAKQRLQISLDSADRKVLRLEAEVQELEAENQSLQSSLEELRILARRLEQLETEKKSLEQETTVLEREKRQLEKENRRLRQQAEIQEASLDSSNVCMATLEKEMRFLVKEAEGLRETAERVRGLEGDNRELTEQAATNQRTLATLREELVNEKLKIQQRDNELERTAHEMETKCTESTQQDGHEAPESRRFKLLESELESSLKQSLQIKEDKMAALGARLQESINRNRQLCQELKTVKMSFEAFQQRREEELTSPSPAPPRETGGTMSEWLRESQEATKELLRLKDRLIEVERNNATLEAECQAMQGQLKQLESQSDSQQAQILALQRQTASLQESNTALQKHNASLQVEKSTLNSQSASLMAQNAQLQQQRSGTEGERDIAIREREELRAVYEQLLRDHERMVALHECQAMEDEALMGKHGFLKSAHRTLELEHRTLQDRYNSLLQQRARLEDLEKALKEEQIGMAVEKEQHRSTAAECCRLRDEKDRLDQAHHQLLNDNESLTTDHKQLKSQLNEAKLKHTWLEADVSKLQTEFQHLDIASTKLTNQCELLKQLKGNLEEENRHLLGQIETLMLQNRTLLEQSMESKDLFHVEERQYIDKLHNLRRQKEKLEEKIMEQYKFHEPSLPRRQGNWIALKLKKLIKPGIREDGPECPPTSRSSPQAPGADRDNSTSASSVGAHGGSSSAAAGDAVSPRLDGTALKMFPHMRKRLKDKDKAKSLFRRSMPVSSSACPSTLSQDEQWAGSSERPEGSEADVDEGSGSPLTSSLTSSVFSTINHPTAPPFDNIATNTAPDASELWLPDKDSHDSTMPSGFEDNEELQNCGLNGAQSRAQSESSGEFNVSMKNEPWSNGSSPGLQPPSRRSSSYQQPGDTSTAQHTVKLQRKENGASTTLNASSQNSDIRFTPKQKDSGPAEEFWLTRGAKSFRRGSRGKVALQHSLESGGTVNMSPGLSGMNAKSSSSKGDSTQALHHPPITVLYVQGKSSSMSGCLNCFSTPLEKDGRLKGPKDLPRASSVISTAEGSSRRSSLNSNCRAMVKTAPPSVQVSGGRLSHEETTTHQQPEPDIGSSEPECSPPVKPPRDPTVAVPSDEPKPPVQESLFDPSFAFDSVFSNTIFSDSLVASTTGLGAPPNDQTFLNPALEQNCPLESPKSPPKLSAALHGIENDYGRDAGGLEMKGE